MNELTQMKVVLDEKYKEEITKLNGNLSSLEKEIIEEEIKDITDEINKVNYLTKIYQKNSKGYIIMKLENLYMMLMENITEMTFKQMTETEKYELFDKYFPDKWAIITDLNLKEKILLNAIFQNELIILEEYKGSGK